MGYQFKTSKRSLFKVMSASALAILNWPQSASTSNNELNLPQQNQFNALIDVILPSDDSVGALDLNINRSIYSRLHTSQHFSQQLVDLLSHINQHSRRRFKSNFESLNLDQQTNLIEFLFSSDIWRSKHQHVFLNLRNQVFDEYYSHPKAFKALKYRPPNQGYHDYASKLS